MTREEKLDWIWLTTIQGVGPYKAHRLLEEYEEPGAVREAYPEWDDTDRAKEILEECEKHQIEIATIHEGLPEIFAQKRDLPILLYRRGTALPIERGIGILGAKNCSETGRQSAVAICKSCADTGELMISGLSKGTDWYSHTAALQNGGKSIAVVAHGLDLCSPKGHWELMNEIMKTGVVLSEYPPGTLVSRFSFPKRNRIIAALSKELNLIDAASYSGAASTIRAAEKYGIPVHIDV